MVAGTHLTKILIDAGAELNIIFANTLKNMGLDVTVLLIPTDSTFYGIVPDKAAMPLVQVTLPVTFGTAENYRTKYT